MTKVNVILLGNPNVGKSSIIDYYMNGKFDPNIQNSVGIEYFSKTVDVEGQEVNLSIWDTAGQEKFHSITPMTARNAHVCIFVADVTSNDSFRDIQSWDEILKKCNVNAGTILAINKIDLEPDLEYAVEKSDGNSINDIVDEIKNLLNIYPNNLWVSAKTGACIDELFQTAAALGFEVIGKIQEPVPLHIDVIDQESEQKKCC